MFRETLGPQTLNGKDLGHPGPMPELLPPVALFVGDVRYGPYCSSELYLSRHVRTNGPSNGSFQASSTNSGFIPEVVEGLCALGQRRRRSFRRPRGSWCCTSSASCGPHRVQGIGVKGLILGSSKHLSCLAQVPNIEQQRYEKQHQSVQIPYMLVAKSSF